MASPYLNSEEDTELWVLPVPSMCPALTQEAALSAFLVLEVRISKWDLECQEDCAIPIFSSTSSCLTAELGLHSYCIPISVLSLGIPFIGPASSSQALVALPVPEEAYKMY